MTSFIISDPTNRNHLPADIIPLCEFVNGLESLSGADILITASKVPATETTLRVHCNKGISVQIKHVGDLVSSLQSNDGRLFRQLVRLKTECAYPMLLIIGDLKAKRIIDEHGEIKNVAVVDGRESGINYFAVIGAIEAWQRRGGFVSWISRDTLMLDWCILQLNNLKKRDETGQWETLYLKHKSPEPLPPETIPIEFGNPRSVQGIEMMTRIETAMCSIPGLGPERVRAVYKEARKYFDNPNLLDCLRIIQDKKIDGIGKDTRGKVMKFIGWSDKPQETK